MRFDLIAPYAGMFRDGLVVTLQFTGLSLAVALALGAVLAPLKLVRCRPLAWVLRLYTSLARGIPLMVLLFLVYFATPQLTGWAITPLQAGVATFGLAGAANVSEVLRGCIQGVDRGQYDAARSLGMTFSQAMRHVMVPEALRSAAPALVNEAITMLKGSALVSTIGVADTLKAATTAQAMTFRSFEPLIVAAIIYYVLVVALTVLGGVLERRLA
ncbi:amino acid ABC transporter permease [Olsenella uli]|uniref:amino acid ABC transporter permease n=1 Tax=Olsenella uli TaxID=133926 RepID=UPI00195A1DA2|nr:amino acid ABC transporter permease [Olsenella uli]